MSHKGGPTIPPSTCMISQILARNVQLGICLVWQGARFLPHSHDKLNFPFS